MFKLKQSANGKKLIEKLLGRSEWVEAGPQWQGLETELQLSGWSKARRVVVLRRALRPEEEAKKSKRTAAQPMILDWSEATYPGVRYEYAGLVTSLTEEVRTIGPHYRDRGDAENNFDEWKNPWAWAGFTPHDGQRCQSRARIPALIYHWGTIFMRLGIPDQHAEAMTSRPLARYGIARRIRPAHPTTIEVTSTHARAPLMAAALRKVSSFLKRIKATAEQLTQPARWRLILSAAFQNFLRGKVLGTPARVTQATF